MKSINLGEADGLPVLDWGEVAGKLESASTPDPASPNARTTWLVTLNEDGTPHVTAVGAIWIDGAFWFQTGDNEPIPRTPTLRATEGRRPYTRLMTGGELSLHAPRSEAAAQRTAAMHALRGQGRVNIREVLGEHLPPGTVVRRGSPRSAHAGFSYLTSEIN